MPIEFSYQLTDSNIYAHLLYRIHQADAEKIDEAEFLLTLENSMKIANEKLQHKDCNIVVLADSDGVIPEEGLGAHAWGSDYIRIFVDPNTSIGLKTAIKKYLPGAIAHELHHSRRSLDIGYGHTLGEALISEGLAQVFQEDLYPDVEVLYAHNLSESELKDAWAEVKMILDSTEYDHDSWFFGSEKIKRWTGYSLGYDIVRKYISRHSEENATTLVDTPAKTLLDGYKS